MLILAIALILSFIPAVGEAQRDEGPKIVWGDDIKFEVPGTAAGISMPTLRLLNKPVERGEFTNTSNRILRKLLKRENVKITEDRIGEDKEFTAWIDKEDPSSLIWQNNKNGNLFFSNQKTNFLHMTKVSLPEGERAMSLATSFMKDLAILPADFENAELLHVGGMFSQDLRDGKTTAKVQHLVSLQWGRVLNGFPVQGPGSKIVVELGNGGEVVSLSKKWNPVQTGPLMIRPELKIREPLHPEMKMEEGQRRIEEERKIDPGMLQIKPILSEYLNAEEVKKLILNELAEEHKTAELVEIHSVRLVYYDRSGNYIQPAYAVEMFVMGKGFEFQYLYHVAALRNPPEPIYPIVKVMMPEVMDIQQTLDNSGTD
jgi:hypothetical protein